MHPRHFPNFRNFTPVVGVAVRRQNREKTREPSFSRVRRRTPRRHRMIGRSYIPTNEGLLELSLKPSAITVSLQFQVVVGFAFLDLSSASLQRLINRSVGCVWREVGATECSRQQCAFDVRSPHATPVGYRGHHWIGDSPP